MLPDVITALGKLGIRCPVSAEWYATIEQWHAWYKGSTAFHSYKVYNGSKFNVTKKYTLKMPKTICEDRADILLNENTDIVVADEASQKYIDDVFDRTEFWSNANQLIETAGWSGTGAFVEYLENGEPQINYISGDHIYPLSWRDNKITECAFASVIFDLTMGECLYIAIHRRDASTGIYTVTNHLFNDKGDQVALPEGTLAVWNTKQTIPTFQIVKFAMMNNLDKNNPMGISLYANAIDVLKTLDTAFDSLANEFIMGRKRIFVDSSIVNVSTEGEIVPLFDPSDTVFYSIPGLSGDTENKLPIRESNMELRVSEHVDTIQAALDLLSLKVGFGRGFYRFEAMQVTTATEVISTDSKMYRRIRKDEIALESALRALTQALLALGGFDPMQEITVQFNDNVIEDTNAIAQRALAEYQSKVISLEQYYEITENLRTKAAQRKARLTREQLKLDSTPETDGNKISPDQGTKEGSPTEQGLA